MGGWEPYTIASGRRRGHYPLRAEKEEVLFYFLSESKRLALEIMVLPN